MNIRVYGDIAGKTVIALGFFDSLHIGHRKLINETIGYARAHGLKSVVCTFQNNPYEALGKDVPLIYNFNERKIMLEEMGVDGILGMGLQPETSAQFFLDGLQQFNAQAFFCGKDYKFGKNASGDISALKEYFKGQDVKIFSLDFEKADNEKVSTRGIRECLANGDIMLANKLLGSNYHVCGRVEHGYKIGRTLGFPTANITYPKDKVKILNGVYTSFVIYNGKKYSGISNVGCRPTFGDSDVKVETYIDNFSEDIYGKDIVVEFVKFIRESIKFESVEHLKRQIEEDIKCLR